MRKRMKEKQSLGAQQGQETPLLFAEFAKMAKIRRASGSGFISGALTGIVVGAGLAALAGFPVASFQFGMVTMGTALLASVLGLTVLTPSIEIEAQKLDQYACYLANFQSGESGALTIKQAQPEAEAQVEEAHAEFYDTRHALQDELVSA